MESSSLQFLRDWLRELAEACNDAELLDLVCKLLLQG